MNGMQLVNPVSLGLESARRALVNVRGAALLLLMAAWLVGPVGVAQARPAKVPVTSAASTPDRELRSLPPEVQAALRRARVPLSAVSVVVQELVPSGAAAGRPGVGLEWQDQVPRNPASVAKLLTTGAALDELGPAWRWRTPVWLAGPVEAGVLHGNLHVQGRGDPQLVLEQLWLLLQRVQARGVRRIDGDIVLDKSRFALPEGSAADFDGDPLRPYNVRADALLLNYHAQVYSFFPDTAAGVARIAVQPLLAGAVVDTTVPLVPGGPCGDWRTTLKPDFGLPVAATPVAGQASAAPAEPVQRVRFLGRYPLACGELNWAVADPHPESYAQRLITALWREMGGDITGRARLGPPPDTPPTFVHASPALAEVVRDINKYSNNVMAQQLFLTLAAEGRSGVQPIEVGGAEQALPSAARESREGANARDTPSGGPAAPVVVTPEDASEHLQAWLLQRLGAEAQTSGALVVDNGSGLSRSGRVTAQLLARLLRQIYDSPTMPEFMASLPIGGVDGTLRRSRATPGRTHMKTGSLRDVTALAGYALSHSGRRYVVVALVNHANAGAARPALDALVQWTLHDLPAR
jgi:serine-type D-Ala-D-Ala carboxypeptidase/endopeptidase (penicillin-binding protein 4)